MRELKDTVNLMLSDDYKDRFSAEFQQLAIRFEKLRKMVDAYKNDKLDFAPACPLDLLEEQLFYMSAYKNSLLRRAFIEGVDAMAGLFEEDK